MLHAVLALTPLAPAPGLRILLRNGEACVFLVASAMIVGGVSCTPRTSHLSVPVQQPGPTIISGKAAFLVPKDHFGLILVASATTDVDRMKPQRELHDMVLLPMNATCGQLADATRAYRGWPLDQCVFVAPIEGGRCQVVRIVPLWLGDNPPNPPVVNLRTDRLVFLRDSYAMSARRSLFLSFRVDDAQRSAGDLCLQVDGEVDCRLLFETLNEWCSLPGANPPAIDIMVPPRLRKVDPALLERLGL